MRDRDALLDSLVELAGMLLSEERIDAVLDRIAHLSTEVFEGCEHAGITLVRDNRVMTATCTDPLVGEVDELQYETQEGPCLESIKTGNIYYIPSIADEGRWQDFVALAEKHEIASVLSYPLQVRDSRFGALNLYSGRVDGFGEDDRRTGAIFATQAAVAVANYQMYDASQKLVDNLHDAMLSRATIEQAKGILMEREGVDATDAFELLRKASQDANVKLRTLAQQVVQSTLNRLRR